MWERRRVRRREVTELVEILRRLHWQCWRPEAMATISVADLFQAMPHLIGNGSVELVWPRLRAGFDDSGAIGLAMERAMRSQVESNCEVESAIQIKFDEAQIPAILVKGWSVARHCPAGVVRPLGHIDVIIPEGDFRRAVDLIRAPVIRTLGVEVDLKHPPI